MGRNLFSSLAIKDNLKVAFLEKNSTNPNKYLVTITVWALAQLFCLMLITRSKSGYMTNFSQKMPLSNYQPWPMMNQKISSIFRFYIPRMYDFCQNWRWPLQLLLKRSLSRCAILLPVRANLLCNLQCETPCSFSTLSCSSYTVFPHIVSTETIRGNRVCTVTFGQKVPKLNSRPVYCS